MRFKSFLLLFSFVLLFNCHEDDNIECSCAAPYFSIEIVDNEGTNLFENGTYDINVIQVTAKGASELGLETKENKSEITFSLAYAVEGYNTYTISLNTAEIDTLVISLTQDNPNETCCPNSTINNVLYNGEQQEIIITNDILRAQKIILVKP